MALGRVIEAEEKLAALMEKRKEHEQLAGARGDGGGVVEALLSGRSLAGGPAVSEEDQKLRELRAEVAALRKARERLTAQVIPGRKERVGYAEKAVEEAVRSVLAASGAAEALMQGLPELEAQVVARRIALCAVIGHLPDSGRGDAAAQEAREYLSNNSILPSPDGVVLSAFAAHPERARWESAIEGLSRNAEARLPKEEGH